MKPKLTHRHRSESSYSYGDWRITVKRRSGGCYPQRRQSWNEVCVTHMNHPGTDWGYGSLKSAIQAINSGKTAIHKTQAP